MPDRRPMRIRGATSQGAGRRGALSVILFLLLFTICSGGISRAARRPNILLILCDDMGFSDLHCYGGEARTPNIDRL
ncbi:MAG TPA: hypothetical protein VHH88_04340, partial [Verrucomicrobiae bacterium]|nr:hypothetical protein [Verrucomicrobiae bacterium]